MLVVAYSEDTAQLTALLPEHNEVFGYREAYEQEPPLRVESTRWRLPPTPRALPGQKAKFVVMKWSPVSCRSRLAVTGLSGAQN